jgi:predicted NUDIX family NTP pyrophosphohydrolase
MSVQMRSAGLLPYRFKEGVEVMIAHPGGPYFARRDDGWWSIVKGLVEAGETDLATARREFTEETGWAIRDDGWVDLGETRLKSRKIVTAWAVESDYDPLDLVPGTFQMGSRRYPEIDRVAWLAPDVAKVKLNPAQSVFVDRLMSVLGL